MVFLEYINHINILHTALSILSSALGVVYGNEVVRRTYTIYKAKTIENIVSLVCGVVVYFSLTDYMGIAFLVSFFVSSHINKFIGVGGVKMLFDVFNKFK